MFFFEEQLALYLTFCYPKESQNGLQSSSLFLPWQTACEEVGGAVSIERVTDPRSPSWLYVKEWKTRPGPPD